MLVAAENLATAYFRGTEHAETFDWRRLDVPTATAFRTWCAARVERGLWAPATANLHIQAMRLRHTRRVALPAEPLERGLPGRVQGGADRRP